ncbi:hypothetical protein BU17DRAFT_42577 [Hysterangium stoloniferum]|nr:hypothetical protein BU17DRAFT_42577 [Hysterangium stoloniferum]
MPTPLSSTNVSGFPPGPEYYEERRRMWLGSPDFESGPGSILQRRSEVSTQRTKLETLLARRSGGADEEAWHSGVKSVYEGLMSGGRLKRRLPLNTVIKVLKAGWMHDGTWPDSLPDPISSPQMSPAPHLPPT